MPDTIPPLIDPYRDLEDDQTSRVNADVATDDLMLIKSVAPQRGNIQTIVNLYVKSIADELRATGATSYSPDNYNTLLSIVHRRTSAGPARQDAKSDDTGRAESVHSSASNSPHKSADVQGSGEQQKVGVKGNKVKGGKNSKG